MMTPVFSGWGFTTNLSTLDISPRLRGWGNGTDVRRRPCVQVGALVCGLCPWPEDIEIALNGLDVSFAVEGEDAGITIVSHRL
jgi:hypothetical protein